jgi:hypothetical protein
MRRRRVARHTYAVMVKAFVTVEFAQVTTA